MSFQHNHCTEVSEQQRGSEYVLWRVHTLYNAAKN